MKRLLTAASLILFGTALANPLQFKCTKVNSTEASKFYVSSHTVCNIYDVLKLYQRCSGDAVFCKLALDKKNPQLLDLYARKGSSTGPFEVIASWNCNGMWAKTPIKHTCIATYWN